MSADRFGTNKSFESLQSKWVGTGNPDMSKFDWAVNQHRDTIASHIGHQDMLSYFATAQNDSVGRVRYELLEKMLQPVGQRPVQHKLPDPSDSLPEASKKRK
jgi:splicing factor 3B subunit 5